MLVFDRGVDDARQFLLNATGLALRHGFLDNLAVDVFAGRFGLWQLQKLVDRDGFGRGLKHQPLPRLAMSTFRRILQRPRSIGLFNEIF